MHELQAVFWDVDGTIADTELDGHRIAFNRAFSDFDLEWNWDKNTYVDLLKISGGVDRIKFYNLSSKQNISSDFCTKIHLRKCFHYKQIINSGLIKPREGVLRLMNELNSQNVSQYIVTTSGRGSLEPLLNTVLDSSQKCLSGTVTYEDVVYHKPHPEAYLKAITYSDCPVENCLAIEDSLNGVMSAKAADINCLMTPAEWCKGDDINCKIANACVDSLGSLINPTNLIYGPPIINKIIDFNYLSRLIN